MKLLDLYCCGGLAAAGYWQSGCFSEIVGVDIADMSQVYPFDFIQSNAIALTYDFLLQFDFIHASPPCQGYSKITPRASRGKHLRLVAATHLMLAATGKPYIIENVEGSGAELRPNLILSGVNVGLPMQRVRYFHVSHERMSSLSFSKISTWYSSQISSGENINPHGSDYVSRDDLITAFGLKSLPVTHLRKLTMYHIEQGIPPEMTRRIAASLFDKVMIG